MLPTSPPSPSVEQRIGIPLPPYRPDGGVELRGGVNGGGRLTVGLASNGPSFNRLTIII